MPALVTGASGHIGSNLVKQLLDQGEKVRALIRKSSNTACLPDHKNLEIVYGDVYDRPSLVAAVTGMPFVYHTAAVYSLSRKNPGQILETAMQGTRNILEAVKVAGGVKRVVYTSSVAAVGMTDDPTRPLDESNWTADSDPDEYTRAKLESEKLAHSLAREFGIDLVAVNPALVLGALDLKPTPSNKVVLDFLQGKVPAYLETGFSAVSVEDVAAGHILAMQKGRSGERYILSGENVKLVDFFEILGKISGKKPPGIKLPRPLAIGMAAMFEFAAGITKSEPLATVQAMKSITNRYGFYSFARAGKELGYKPRPLDQTLRSTVEWFEKNPLT
ncbi:MAG TPA: SDR family oxidoreductase [Leptospiraceae bacterium]|nr:SDR family oxidoreductase [Leptospiraceae bacterium]HMY43956.1 SDR family oxidoreductase [Leptospiraceae bacterium]HNJ33360.1 SDR family oxidoreductase [Leptospiraceae bacterium]HNN57546.1 SDR family oxidoreductase [Leptospiraceae bacterium]